MQANESRGNESLDSNNKSSLNSNNESPGSRASLDNLDYLEGLIALMEIDLKVTKKLLLSPTPKKVTIFSPSLNNNPMSSIFSPSLDLSPIFRKNFLSPLPKFTPFLSPSPLPISKPVDKSKIVCINLLDLFIFAD